MNPKFVENIQRTWGGGKAKLYYPILNWTNEDVERFIKEREIKCHPRYYDENGKFHVERRVGCMACPLKTDIISDFVKYPKLLKLWIKNAQINIDLHPDSSNAIKFNNDAYRLMMFRLFYEGKHLDKFNNVVDGGMFPETAVDCKSYLEEYFKIDLTI